LKNGRPFNSRLTLSSLTSLSTTESKKEGVATHQTTVTRRPPLMAWAYSDGSLLEGMVGAGAVVEVVREEGEVGEVKLLQSLGEKQTVWVGEVS
jgi:hypothetical protein